MTYKFIMRSLNSVLITGGAGYVGSVLVRKLVSLGYDVKVIKSVSGNLKIKASGGISNLKDALAMIEAGADRIGTSKAVDIFNEK